MHATGSLILENRSLDLGSARSVIQESISSQFFRDELRLGMHRGVGLRMAESE